jgi:hypothetical protein
VVLKESEARLNSLHYAAHGNFFQRPSTFFIPQEEAACSRVYDGQSQIQFVAQKWCKAVKTVEEREVSSGETAISTNLSTLLLKSYRTEICVRGLRQHSCSTRPALFDRQKTKMLQLSSEPSP